MMGSGRDLLPVRLQAIILTNAGIFLGTNFYKILFENEIFHARKYIWKCPMQNGGHFVTALCWEIYYCIITLV